MLAIKTLHERRRAERGLVGCANKSTLTTAISSQNSLVWPAHKSYHGRMVATSMQQYIRRKVNAAKSILRRLRIALLSPLAKTVLCFTIFAWALTIAGYCYLDLANPNRPFISSIFQNWASDVLFFTLIVSLLTVVSSLPPELESFENRARILFQGRHGSEVNYAKEQLRLLGNYSEKTTITIVIEEVDEWFRVSTRTAMRVRNLIDDITTEYQMLVRDPEQVKNPNDKPWRVLSFSADGEARYSVPTTSAAPEKTYKTEIGGAKTAEIEVVLESWVRETERISHTPARFSKHITVAAINRSGKRLYLRLSVPEKRLVELLPDQMSAVELFTVPDARPQKLAYSFRLFGTRRQAARGRWAVLDKAEGL